MTFLVVGALVVFAAVIGMMLSVQRRNGGFYAHPSGQDTPKRATPEQQAGAGLDNFPVHHP
jgi:cytochrome c-type biogenesis protein CcmE